MNEKGFFAVRYISGNSNNEKYVGSVQDYKDGGYTDPVPMSEKEANALMQELDKYVKSERIGRTDEDNEQAHYAYDKHEWGFGIVEFEYPVLDDDDENDIPSAGLDRNSTSISYNAGRVIAVIEHYASDRFGKLTLTNMFAHPLAVASAFVNYVEKNDEYFAELKGIAYLPQTMTMAEQSTAWVGYYHQKMEYDRATKAPSIAETLKMTRNKRQMTIKELSERTGINASNLSRIERGEVYPNLQTLATICKALGLTIEIK